MGWAGTWLLRAFLPPPPAPAQVALAVHIPATPSAACTAPPLHLHPHPQPPTPNPTPTHPHPPGCCRDADLEDSMPRSWKDKADTGETQATQEAKL